MNNELTYEIDDTGPIWVAGGWRRWFENFLPIPRKGMHLFWLSEALDLAEGIFDEIRAKGGGEHTVTLTGHSRGGAVAMYIAYLLSRSGYPVSVTLKITGAPRMWFGEDGWVKDTIVRLHCTVDSTIATSDPVTWGPPGWRHTKSRIIDSGRWPRLKHHTPKYYREALQ